MVSVPILQPVNESSETMPLSITYAPMSVGKLRLWVNFQESIKMLHKFGKIWKCFLVQPVLTGLNL